eukprot:434100_1
MCFPLKMFHDATVKVYDATPCGLWCPFIHKRIYKVTPQAKMIILLRNPIHRTKSHMQFLLHEAEGVRPMFIQKMAHQDMTQVIQWYYDNDEMVQRYLDAQEKVGVEESVPHYVPMLLGLPLIHQDMTQVIQWYYVNDEMVQRYLDAQEKVGVEESVPHYVPMLLGLPLIHRSLYFKNIKRILKTFDREQILVIHLEELNTNMCGNIG